MPLPPLIRQLAEQKLSLFCQKRIPEGLRNEIRLGFSFRGNSVTLHEERPDFLDRDRWTLQKIAQFRYDPDSRVWQLFWRDRNRRWHPYWDHEPTKSLGLLIAEVDQDPTGIFWG